MSTRTRDDFRRAFDLAEDEPEIIRWRDLDAPTATAELSRLADWVDWLTNRYNLDHKLIPPCWSQHGALVEELSALRTLWEASYLEDANPSAPSPSTATSTSPTAASANGPPASAAPAPSTGQNSQNSDS